MGDIVPVTDGGRAIIFIWSFVGTGLWGVVIGGLVIKLTNWIYVDILMASYYDIKKRKHAKQAAREMRTTTQGEEDEENPKAKKQRVEEEAAAAGQIEPLEAKVLPWYSLPLLNGIGVVLWFSIHLTFAAVLGATEPMLGNLGDLTPDSFGNHFYFSLVASQTICTYKRVKNLFLYYLFYFYYYLKRYYLFIYLFRLITIYLHRFWYRL